jgi:hypothetical protein
MPAAKANPSIYQLKITLLDIIRPDQDRLIKGRRVFHTFDSFRVP